MTRVTLFDFIKGEVITEIYSGLDDKVEALVKTYMTYENLASQLHNVSAVNRVKLMVKEGKYAYSIQNSFDTAYYVHKHR